MVKEHRYKVLRCKRCGYRWFPRVKTPTICPGCRSPYWNKEKQHAHGGAPGSKAAPEVHAPLATEPAPSAQPSEASL